LCVLFVFYLWKVSFGCIYMALSTYKKTLASNDQAYGRSIYM